MPNRVSLGDIYEIEKDNCIVFDNMLNFNCLITCLFCCLLSFLLTEPLLMRYQLISYDRKPLIYQSVLLNYIIMVIICNRFYISSPVTSLKQNYLC